MTKARSFTFLSEGKVPQSISEAVRDAVAAAKGEILKLTLGKAKETASDKQRKYYFAVIVAAYQRYFDGQQKFFDKDQMHDSMMRAIGGFSNPYVNPFTGEPDQGRTSYNDLTTAQAEGYHELCRAWLAEKGVQCMMPNEFEQQPEGDRP